MRSFVHILGLIVFSLLARPALAQALVPCTSAASGNWNAAATWAPPCNVSGPNSTNAVTIANGHTVTVSATATAGSIDVSGGGTLTANRALTVSQSMSVVGAASINGSYLLTINQSLSIGGTLNVNGGINVLGPTAVSGTLTIGSTLSTKAFRGDVSVTGTWNETVSEAVDFYGSLQNSGNFSVGDNASAHTFRGTGKTISGTLSIPAVTIAAAPASYTNTGNLTVPTTLRVYGAFLNAGTMTASSQVLNAGILTNGDNATLNIGAATVGPTLVATAPGNTVNYLAAGNQTVRAATYNNLVLKGSGTKTIPASTINGDFKMEDAAIAQPSGTSTYNGGFTIGATNTFNANSRTVNINGTFVNDGALMAGTSTFVFGGALAQTPGGSSPLSFYNLTVNKTAGTVTLAKDATVGNTLRLNAGTITTGANVLFLSKSDCSGNVIRSTGYVGYVIGNLKMSFPATANRTCSFHVGDSVGYAPVTVAKMNSSNAGTLVARVDVPDPANSIPDSPVNIGIDPGRNANHYWTLTKGSTGGLDEATPYRATFRYCAANTCLYPTEVDTGADYRKFLVSVRATPGGTWVSRTVRTRLVYQVQTQTATGFGVFEVGEKMPVPYDHLGIFLPPTSCPGAASITVKACQDLECTLDYTGTVQANLSVTGSATWSSANPVTLTNGTLTLNLTDNTRERVTLGATATGSPLPAGATQCYGGGEPDGCSVLFGPCGFDAVELGNDPGTPIFTKMANTNFDLKVVSLLETAVTPSRIEVVDASRGGCAEHDSLQEVSSSLFGAGEAKTLTFSSRAARVARIRVTYPGAATPACSTDVFAVRPPNFTPAPPEFEGTPLRAGVTAATVRATTAAGYNGTPQLNLGRIAVVTGVRGQVTGPLGATFSFAPATMNQDGTTASASANLVYWETGSFNLLADAIFDNTFTEVDPPNSECWNPATGSVTSEELVNGMYACTIGSRALGSAEAPAFGPYIPAYFLTTATPACRAAGKTAFTYSDQPFATTVSACAGADTACASRTSNYAGSVTFSGIRADGVTANGTFRPDTAALPNGTASFDLTYTYNPQDAAPVPVELRIRAVDEQATSNANTEASLLFRRGRLKFDSGVGAELLAMPMKVTAQHYASSDEGWRTNTDDSCTTLRNSALPIHSSDSTTSPCRLYGEGVPLSCALPTTRLTPEQAGILVNNPVTPKNAPAQMTVNKSSPRFTGTSQTQALVDGITTFRMSAPGVAGSLDVTLLVPDHLKYNGNFPSAKLSFGIYKGVKSVIHFREQY